MRLSTLSLKRVYLPAIFGGHIKKLLPMSPKICRCKILCNHWKTDNRGHYTKKKIDNALFFKMFTHS